MSTIRKIVFSTVLLAFSAVPALAQSLPPWPITTYGYVATPAQWGQAFQLKQDYLGAAPCITTGCTFTGPIITAPSTAIVSGFNIPPGIAPTSPNNGDIWETTAGIFARVNGSTIGPIGTAACPTCAVTNASNIFTAAQEINLNSGSLQSPQTGTLLQVGNANGGISRVEIDSYANVGVHTCTRADGTASSPTTLQVNDEICSISAFGYNGTSFVGGAARISLFAAQNWSVGANGSYIRFGTIANGSAAGTPVDRLSIENDGGVEVPPGISGGDKGVGTINAVGFYVSGNAVASSVSAPLTLNASTGALSITGAAGQVLAGATPAFTATPVLGVAGSVVGSIGFQNASTGTQTITPATGALGSGVATLAAGTYNLVGDSLTQTLTNKTITSSTNSLGGVTMTLGSDANGDLYCRSGGILTRIPGGAAATLLTSGGVTVCPTWVAAAGGGNVSNTGTPTANQMAQWTNATTIQGVNVASVLTAGSGIAITGTTNATIALASQAAFSAGLSANQTGIASSTSTLVTYNTTVYNVGALFNTTTNRWVPPAGTVVLDACVYATGTLQTANSISAFIYKNGSPLYQAINDIVSTQGGNCITVQDRANGTDYYQVFVNVTTTAGTATLPTGLLNFFHGHWVSP